MTNSKPKFIEVHQMDSNWNKKVSINTDQIVCFNTIQRDDGSECVMILMTHGTSYHVMESYEGIAATVAGFREA